MRVLGLLLILIAFPVHARANPSDAGAIPVEYLLDSAAADFRAHPPQALAFRKVYFGQFEGEGRIQY